jgi:hypothetical protein
MADSSMAMAASMIVCHQGVAMRLLALRAIRPCPKLLYERNNGPPHLRVADARERARQGDAV